MCPRLSMLAANNPIPIINFQEFLAAMRSSSLSVCVSGCVSGVILFSKEHSEHLKQDVFRELQGCLKGVCLKFEVGEISRVFEKIPRVFK